MGAGTFVADISGLDELQLSAAARDNLHQIVESAVRQAVSLGYSIDDVRRAFVDQHGSNGHADARWVALVGNFQAVSQAYAHEIEALLADLQVQVRV
jgi:hypothetical protein